MFFFLYFQIQTLDIVKATYRMSFAYPGLINSQTVKNDPDGQREVVHAGVVFTMDFLVLRGRSH